MAQEHLGNPAGADPHILGTITDALVGGLLGAIDAENDTQFVNQFLRMQRDAFDREMVLDQQSLSTAMTRADTFDLQLEDEASALRYADPDGGAIYGQIDTWYQDALANAKTPQSRAAVDTRYMQLQRRAKGAHSQAQQRSFHRAGLSGDYSWYSKDNDDASRVMLEHTTAEHNRKKWAMISSEAERYNQIGQAVTTSGKQFGMLDPYPLMQEYPEVYELLGVAQKLGASELSTLPPEQLADVMSKLTNLQANEIQRASGAAEATLSAKEFDATADALNLPEIKGLVESGGATPIMDTNTGVVKYRFSSEAVEGIVSKMPKDVDEVLPKIEALEQLGTGNIAEELRAQAVRHVGGPGEYVTAEQDAIVEGLDELIGLQQTIAPIAAGGHQAQGLKDIGLGVGGALQFTWAADTVDYYNGLSHLTKGDFAGDPERLASFLRTPQAGVAGAPGYTPNPDLTASKSLYLAHSLLGDPNPVETTLATQVRSSMASEARLDDIDTRLNLHKLQGTETSLEAQHLQQRRAEIESLRFLPKPQAMQLDARIGSILALSRGQAENVDFDSTFAFVMYQRDGDGRVLTAPVLDKDGQPTGDVQAQLSIEGQELLALFNTDMLPTDKLQQSITIIADKDAATAELISQVLETTGPALNASIPTGSLQQAQAQIAGARDRFSGDQTARSLHQMVEDAPSTLTKSPRVREFYFRDVMDMAAAHHRYSAWVADTDDPHGGGRAFKTAHPRRGDPTGPVHEVAPPEQRAHTFLAWLKKNPE